MGGVTASVKVKDEGVRDLFKRLKKRGADTAPVMRAIGELIRSSVVKNFEEGGRPRWKPSAKPKGKTLIDTARLLGSINSKASKDRAEVGTNAVYAAIHQFGGQAGRGRKVAIPARPYLVVQDEDMTEIKAVIRDHIMAAEKGG